MTSKTKKNTGVTTREKNFVRYYIANPNATKAYMRAFECDNRESAGVLASKLLKKVRVREFLDEERIAFWTPQLPSREEVIMMLANMARGITLCDNVVIEGRGQGESEAVIKRSRPKDSVMRAAQADLAKIHGLFNDNQINVTVGVIIEDDIAARLRSKQEVEE